MCDWFSSGSKHRSRAASVSTSIITPLTWKTNCKSLKWTTHEALTWTRLCNKRTLNSADWLCRIGPPIIGGEARSKFSKFWTICSDKISKFCPNMFGSEQAFAKKVKFCSDSPSGPQKNQICSDWPIWPQKNCIFTYNYYEIATLHPSHQHQLPVSDLDPSCELLQ